MVGDATLEVILFGDNFGTPPTTTVYELQVELKLEAHNNHDHSWVTFSDLHLQLQFTNRTLAEVGVDHVVKVPHWTRSSFSPPWPTHPKLCPGRTRNDDLHERSDPRE